jgi:hypothetical protein
MKRFKGCLGVFLVFFFGVLFGCAITAGVIHEKILDLVKGGPEGVVTATVKLLEKDLKLDDEQREMVHQIALDTRIRLRKIRQETEPEVDRTLNEAADRVRGILNPDQAKKFDEIVKKGRSKWKSGSKGDAEKTSATLPIEQSSKEETNPTRTDALVPGETPASASPKETP